MKRSSQSKDHVAYRAIKELLLSRKLVAGQKIISRRLEELLDMSKTPIASALARLEQEGLLVSQRNRGYDVRDWHKLELSKMFDLKILLEDLLLESAIETYLPHELKHLKAVLDEYLSYSEVVYDLNRFKLDMKFHIKIAEMSKNSFFVSILRQYYDIGCIALNIVAMTPLIQQFRKDHEMIFEAIKSKNVAKAREILVDHENSSRVLLS